jgi:hypothetical protein
MQYFSKWRKEWIDFTPTNGQIIQMKKYNYLIREKTIYSIDLNMQVNEYKINIKSIENKY